MAFRNCKLTCAIVLPVGKKGCVVQEPVTRLCPGDRVQLDVDRIHKIYTDLGPTRAEDVICRAIEEMALRLFRSDGLWTTRDTERLGTCLRALIAIADQVGMLSITQVARDVQIALSRKDEPAVAATLARLRRVGESSMTNIWDIGNLSG